MGAALNMFLAFMVLAGSALSFFLIYLQTIPLALSAVAAAALLAQTLMQRPPLWMTAAAASLVWVGALAVYVASSGQVERSALVVLVAASVVLTCLTLAGSWGSLGLVSRTLLVMLLVILTGASAFGAAVWIDPNVLTSRWAAANLTDARETAEVRADGTTQITDVDYGSRYPNGYLDVYLAKNAGSDAPTLVYVHGGGYVFGDKLFGDPTGNANGGFYVYLERYLEVGYNIVSINYAHPPVYTYPVPVMQLAEAMKFMVEEGASRWGIDMHNVSFACGSAGGNITGMFVLAQVDSDYAGRTGIPQVLAPDDIRSVAFNCAVLDNARMGRTEDRNPVMDYGGDACTRSYLGVAWLDETDAALADSNVISNVTSAMPPCFIDDGTRYTYGDQAKELAARLEEPGVEHELHIFEGEPHSFDTTDSAAARESLDLQIAFMDRFTR